jgi:transcriptional regulator with XRE-family HTH domain
VCKARIAAGLSQRSLSFPGCSAAYISRIERGERIPSLQVMREIAARTGVSEAYLAYGRNELLDAAVARRVREAEAAESGGTSADRQRAYAALARAASSAAKATSRTS